MEGEPKLMDKVFDKFAQWADWSEKDPVREIIFVICTHIVGLLLIILSPIIAMIAAHSYTNAQREQEAKEDEELLEWWRREREEEYVKWVRSNGRYKGEDEYEYEDEDEYEYENERG